MPRLTRFLLLLTLSAALLQANTPAPSPNYYHLTNTPYVFRVTTSGELTFLNTGESGQLAIASDQTFVGTFAETAISGKLADDKLWLRRSNQAAPVALEYLECRPVDERTAHEILGFSRRARSDLSGDLPRALRTSLANAIRNRLALLAESVMFHCLENVTEKVENLSDLIGPDKQLRALPSIDGEDYSTLDLTPNTAWTIESASGIKATHGPSPE